MNSMRDQVLRWLGETGFPLEMVAANAFRMAGFEVQQSATYADPISEKGREIDVLAADPDIWGFVDLAVVLECKSSSKPWVVLTADDALRGHNLLRTFAVMSDRARIALTRSSIKESPLFPFLHPGTRCGYGFRQAFSKESDPAYGAAMNVVTACRAVVADKPSFMKLPTVSVAFPIIVVDAPLFECELQPGGELALSEVESSEFVFSAHLPNHVLCMVRVVSRSKIFEFARWNKEAVAVLRAELEPEQERILKSLRKRAEGDSGDA